MRWYIKLAGNFIQRDDYNPRDDYFLTKDDPSRGVKVHDPEDQWDTYTDYAHGDHTIIWAWNPEDGEIQDNQTYDGIYHHQIWDVEGGEVTWRGRYDPQDGDLTILTHFITEAGPKREPPPAWLLNKLKERYSPITIHLF
jgi:hypothetical protein